MATPVRMVAEAHLRARRVAQAHHRALGIGQVEADAGAGIHRHRFVDARAKDVALQGCARGIGVLDRLHAVIDGPGVAAGCPSHRLARAAAKGVVGEGGGNVRPAGRDQPVLGNVVVPPLPAVA